MALTPLAEMLEGFPVKSTGDTYIYTEAQRQQALKWLGEQKEFKIKGRDKVYTREEVFGKEPPKAEPPKDEKPK